MIFDPPTPAQSVFDDSKPCKKETVVIIIPTYNEACVIKETLVQLYTTIQLLPSYDIKILIFDSSSTDNTQAIVQSLQNTIPQLYLESEHKKSGLGSAYMQSMRYAMSMLQADIVFEFDADLSHQPQYIPVMLDNIKTCDVVVGSRYVKGGSIPNNWGWHRKVISVLGNYVARAVLTFKYKDFTSGFRATRCAILKKILPEQFISNQYAYKLQLFWLLHQSGARIREIPIHFIDRVEGESKLPKNSVIDSMHVIFKLRYYALKRYLKMCLVGTLGMSVQFIAYNALRTHLPPFNASQIAVFIAIINNFILNGQFTFKNKFNNKDRVLLKRVGSFAVYSIAMVYFQSYWLKVGLSVWGSGLMQENLIIIMGMGATSVLNYFIYSRLIWPDTKISPSTPV